MRRGVVILEDGVPGVLEHGANGGSEDVLDELAVALAVNVSINNPYRPKFDGVPAVPDQVGHVLRSGINAAGIKPFIRTSPHLCDMNRAPPIKCEIHLNR